jgi:hypothetical protein
MSLELLNRSLKSTKRAIKIGLNTNVELRILYFTYDENKKTVTIIATDDDYEDLHAVVLIDDKKKRNYAVCQCIKKEEIHYPTKILDAKPKKYGKLTNYEKKGIVAAPVRGQINKKILGALVIDSNTKFEDIPNMHDLNGFVATFVAQLGIIADLLIEPSLQNNTTAKKDFPGVNVNNYGNMTMNNEEHKINAEENSQVQQFNNSSNNTAKQSQNKSKEEKEDSLFKKPLFYVVLGTIIYFCLVLFAAYDLQQQGKLGNKTFKEIVLSPIQLLKTDK